MRWVERPFWIGSGAAFGGVLSKAAGIEILENGLPSFVNDQGIDPNDLGLFLIEYGDNVMVRSFFALAVVYGVIIASVTFYSHLKDDDSGRH